MTGMLTSLLLYDVDVLCDALPTVSMEDSQYVVFWPLKGLSLVFIDQTLVHTYTCFWYMCYSLASTVLPLSFALALRRCCICLHLFHDPPLACLLASLPTYNLGQQLYLSACLSVEAYFCYSDPVI